MASERPEHCKTLLEGVPSVDQAVEWGISYFVAIEACYTMNTIAMMNRGNLTPPYRYLKPVLDGMRYCSDVMCAVEFLYRKIGKRSYLRTFRSACDSTRTLPKFKSHSKVTHNSVLDHVNGLQVGETIGGVNKRSHCPFPMEVSLIR